MPFTEHALAVGPDRLHFATLPRGEMRIRFDRDAWLPTPVPGIGVWMAVAGNGRRAAVIVDGREIVEGGGDVWLIHDDGTSKKITTCIGLHSAALFGTATGFEVEVQQRFEVIDVYDELGKPVLVERTRAALDDAGQPLFDASGQPIMVRALVPKTYPVPYASAGILQLLPDGTPRMTTDPLATQNIDGVVLFFINESNGYRVGSADCGDSPDGGAVLITPSGRKLMRQGYSPLPVRIAAKGDQCILGISGHDSPDPDTITLDTLEPYRPFVPPPVVFPESIIPPQRATWIVDTEGISTPRGNGISTIDGPPSGPIFEDAEWIPPPREKDIEALYFGPEPSRWGKTKDEQALFAGAMAVRNGAPICVCDEFGADATAGWIARLQGLGARAAWMVEAYRPVTESRDAYRARLRARFAAILPAPYAVVGPYYEAQGGGSELECQHTVNILREVLAEQPAPPILIDLFGLRRPPRSARREADAAAWIAAVPRPASLRVPVEPRKPVETAPPVGPVAVHPGGAPQPPHRIDAGGLSTKDKQIAAGAAAGGLVAALLTWWRRRRS